MNKNLDKTLDKISKLPKDKKVVETQKEVSRKIKNDELKYDIDYENDNPYIIAAKEAINASNLTKQDVYDVYGRRDGYNLIYTLYKGVFTFEKAEKWAKIMGKTLKISFED